MRTTLTIDDDLYRAAKSHAALTGQSVGSVIEDALRTLLARSEATATYVPDLPTFDLGPLPGIDYTDTSALMHLGEEKIPLDARR